MKTYRVSMVVRDDYGDWEDTAFTEAELRDEIVDAVGQKNLTVSEFVLSKVE